MIFLHGFMGSGSDWLPVVERLAASFRCILVDLPGHGRSLGLSGRYTMERTGVMLVDVLDRAEETDAHVVGYSMGGRTALYVAAMHGRRCRRLVLESASPGLETEDGRADRRRVDAARATRIETCDMVEFLEDWYRQPLFETYRRHEGLFERMIRSRSANAPKELARSLRDMGTGSQSSLWQRLAGLEMPVLTIAGALDEAYVDTARRMAARIPQCREAVVSDAGHNVHAERPEIYAELLIDFLNKPT